MPTCYLKVTVQLGDGTEETVYETSTTNTDWTDVEKAVTKIGEYNQKVTVRFYLKTDDSDYPAQMCNPIVRGRRYGRRLQIPT